MLCIALTFNAFTYYTCIIAAITFTKNKKINAYFLMFHKTLALICLK